jgi:hypothetical protein
MTRFFELDGGKKARIGRPEWGLEDFGPRVSTNRPRLRRWELAPVAEGIARPHPGLLPREKVTPMVWRVDQRRRLDATLSALMVLPGLTQGSSSLGLEQPLG